jgi:hypothetical protein
MGILERIKEIGEWPLLDSLASIALLIALQSWSSPEHKIIKPRTLTSAY